MATANSAVFLYPVYWVLTIESRQQEPYQDQPGIEDSWTVD